MTADRHISERSLISLLSRKDAAEYLGIKPQTLAVWACTGRYAIPFVRVGRAVRYRQEDLDRWLQSRTVTPTELATAP